MKSLHKNRIIVACSQNYNGYGMLRSLHDAGIIPTMLINHSTSPIISISRFRKKIIYYNIVAEIPQILLDKFSSESNPPIVICCDDNIQSVVDDNLNLLSKYFILANAGGKEGNIKKLMSKSEQMRIAQECGINTPKTWYYNKGDIVTDNISFPCFLKSDSSLTGGKSDMGICLNKYELQKMINQRSYIVQEYIDKDYEITIWGTSIGNNAYFMSGVGKKLRQFPNERGLSSYLVLESFENYKNLHEESLKNMLRKMQYIGMFNIEMAVKDNNYYLLEVNLRNGGKQHFSTVAGANLPEMYIQSRLGMPVDTPEVKYPTYCMGELTDYQFINKRGG